MTKKHVIIFEARGGNDKGPYGIRNDSKSIVDSLTRRGWTSEVVFYQDEDRGAIYKYTVDNAGAYISRVNPGNLKDESGYFQFLRELVKADVHGLPHPDAMINFGAKNAIEKLTDTELVPTDTFCYYNFKSFKEKLPQNLAKGPRVIKQNRGSTGEGIWKVELVEEPATPVKTIPLKAMVKCTEAKDNHVEHKTLGQFIDFCVQYLDGVNGMLLDMKYLPRIIEGEIRVLMLRRKPINVVHKMPAANNPDAFSATLFSGAKYTYESPEKWPELIEVLTKNVNKFIDKLGGYDIPLLWTADFILDTDPKTGKDKYILGEINASCVGFSTHLELSEIIADEIVGVMETESIVNHRWPAYKE